MDNTHVAVAQYCPNWWPANTALLIRRVLLDPAQVSADPQSRRCRTLHPDRRALPIPELAGAWQGWRFMFRRSGIRFARCRLIARPTSTSLQSGPG